MSDDENVQSPKSIDPNDVAISETGLPAHWTLKTSVSSSEHHEDLPLFPPLIEKPLIKDTNSEELLSTQNVDLLAFATKNNLIKNNVPTHDLISGKRVEDNLLSNPIVSDELPSGTEEVLISSGKVDEDFLLPKPTEDELKIASVTRVALVQDSNKVESLPQENIIEQAKENLVTENPVVKEVVVEKIVQENITKIEPKVEAPSLVETTPIYSEPIKEVVLEEPKQSGAIDVNSAVPVEAKKQEIIQTPQNPKPIISSKVFPVPHAPIVQTTVSNHHLALPPQVIPFSTSAPSAHAKIAAVYTQPDARVAEWLPWMRTSQWSKRRVARATKNPEITIEHASLPAISSKGKPNVIYTPVYITERNVDINKAIKQEVTKPENIPQANIPVYEPQAPIIRMQPALDVKQNIEPPKASSPVTVEIKEQNRGEVKPIKYIHPKVVDPVDTAIFGAFVDKKTEAVPALEKNAVNNVKQGTLANQFAKIETPQTSTVNEVVKPQILDSWDTAMFS